MTASDLNPESSAIERQHRERLWQGVRLLPLPDRQLMILHLEGLTAADAASITGLTPGNVATRLTRARQALVATIRGGDEQ
jgi:DNA-directed RNA polymerase specialized sigma24 family protein